MGLEYVQFCMENKKNIYERMINIKMKINKINKIKNK